MIAAVMLTILAVTTLHAQPGRFSRTESDSRMPIETERGYLFVNGEYLQPPYKIEADFEKDLIRINGADYSADAFDLSGLVNLDSARRRGGEGGRRGMGFRDGGWDRGRERQAEFAEPSGSVSARTFFRELDTLRLNTIVVLQNERPPLFLSLSEESYALLSSLIATDSGFQDAMVIPDAVQSPAEREVWEQLVSQFVATPAFLQRAKLHVEKMDAEARQVDDFAAAIELSSRISYPLTTFALVLVVVAIGHLLIHAQPMFGGVDDPSGLENIKKATVLCLVIVGLMSGIDLIWTLIANQNGSMRELNPLGSKLIDNPAQLIMFKFVVTSISIGLLFWFREIPFARRATWWCCLVLTLLTARWLTFHSLFA
ncbi:DUF5658 family protein [Rubripirellula reticaptiva]|nr:DUF5658 family protein [Rubripirellula reticaptiva]